MRYEARYYLLPRKITLKRDMCLEKRFNYEENVITVKIIRQSDMNLRVKVDVLKCSKK